jgi:AcrR family transcriptional regulator
MEESAGRRKRRRVAELRRDILSAAQMVFSEKGYASTTIREIADHSQASERLIYRHFNSKADLFAAAVFDPVERIIDEQLNDDKIAILDAMPPVEGIRYYAKLVISTIRQEKPLFIAYLNAITFHRSEFSHISDRYPASFRDRLLYLESITYQPMTASRFLLRDNKFEARLTFLFLWAVALFDDVFLESEVQDDEREIRSVVKLMAMGIGLADPDAPDARDLGSGTVTSAREKALEKENLELRMLFADAVLENRALKASQAQSFALNATTGPWNEDSQG